MLYTYYNEKLMKFLTNSEVIQILDKDNNENKKSCNLISNSLINEENVEDLLQNV